MGLIAPLWCALVVLLALILLDEHLIAGLRDRIKVRAEIRAAWRTLDHIAEQGLGVDQLFEVAELERLYDRPAAHR